MMPLDIVIMARKIDSRIMNIVYEFLFPDIDSLFMGARVWYLQTLLPFRAFVNFPILVTVGAVLYAAAVVGLEATFQWEVSDNPRSIYRNLAS